MQSFEASARSHRAASRSVRICICAWLLVCSLAAREQDPKQATPQLPTVIPSASSEKADQRRAQIAGESAALLKLATELKIEVDKTTKETLSITVIRKAGDIEKLAHSARAQARLTDGVGNDGAH